MEYRRRESHKSCPYDPCHQILPHRFAKHLVKCKKNHPDCDMKTCPFNATHVIPTSEIQAHLLECPDKGPVEREIYIPKAVEKVLDIKNSNTLPSKKGVCEDDWELDLKQNPYNVKVSIKTKSFYLKWRLAEIDRVTRLRAGKPIDKLHSDTSISASSASLFGSKDSVNSALKKSTSNLLMCADTPVRRPKLVSKATRLRARKPIDDKVLTATSISASSASLFGNSSIFPETKDAANSGLTERMRNLVIRADTPLRRPRIAANIFGNDPECMTSKIIKKKI